MSRGVLVSSRFATTCRPFLDRCGLCTIPSISSARILSKTLKNEGGINASPSVLYAASLLREAMLFVLRGVTIRSLTHQAPFASFIKTISLKEHPACLQRAEHEFLVVTLFGENRALKSVAPLLVPPSIADHSFDLSTVEELREPVPGFSCSLLELLKEPLLAHPDDLGAQLRYIATRWHTFLPEELVSEILRGSDILKEEWKASAPGPGPTVIPDFSSYDVGEITEELFTADTDWMPRAVMIAKNCFVWLDQLSRHYGQPITRLDQVPDDELRLLADRGFNLLWLIGVWERSEASKQIKRIRGNSEAAASAYSLIRYDIAAELGGNSALRDLARRAERYGIRLAGDMVPNHTAIDSDWIYEHPDWFIQRDSSPFDYSFTGPDLSRRPDVTIQIEDGYWNNSDAAVVFRYYEHATGRVRYIYHGNDGTTMPWNDTAQLDFLNEEVRHAVKETIFHVASLFSVIRFDAAMTLTKRHFHRLWFPAPGTGGDIPSRTEYSLSFEEFNRRMPAEFWRTVVDEALHRSPDTLLLAEAFWLMESYFVRSLGMHRVYNSAFMNFLKNEDGAKFRAMITGILAYDPDVAQRYVNFLSNPDEETAIEQFGDGDKYMGAVLLMVTMPGLPMFAHGQIEGFREKYGMEYQRAYWNETVNWDLVRRHEQLIFPLMKKRYLFSGVKQFNLFGMVNRINGLTHESVTAYTNGSGGKKVLILFNNSSITCDGHLEYSAPKKDKKTGTMKTVHIADELHITKSGGFLLFEDLLTKSWYIRPAEEIQKGFYWMLGPYEHRCFSSFRHVVPGKNRPWDVLFQQVGKSPFVDPVRLLASLRYQNVENALAELFTPSETDKLFAARKRAFTASVAPGIKRILTHREQLIRRLYSLSVFSRFDSDPEYAVGRCQTAVLLPYIIRRRRYTTVRKVLIPEAVSDNKFEFLTLLFWSVLADFSWDFVRTLPFAVYFKKILIKQGADEQHAELLSRIPEAFLLLDQVTEADNPLELFELITSHTFLRSLLLINRWKEREFCNKEALLTLIRGFVVTAVVRFETETPTNDLSSLYTICKVGTELASVAEQYGYDIARIHNALQTHSKTR